MKIARVTPVFKVDDRTISTYNYFLKNIGKSNV